MAVAAAWSVRCAGDGDPGSASEGRRRGVSGAGSSPTSSVTSFAGASASGGGGGGGSASSRKAAALGSSGGSGAGDVGSGAATKLVFGGGEKYVSRYATSKSAVNVGGKLEKQDDKRKELVSRAFYGHRKADRSGTVGVPLYRPGSPFPVLIHASTRKPEEVHLPAQSRKSLLLAAAHRRPVTAF